MDPEGGANLRPKESVTVLLLLPPPALTYTQCCSLQRGIKETRWVLPVSRTAM